MPRLKQTPKNGRETSESGDATDMFASTQQKMTTVGRPVAGMVDAVGANAAVGRSAHEEPE